MSRVCSVLLACGLAGCFVDAPADDTGGDDFAPRDGLRTVGIRGSDTTPEVVHGTYRVPVPDDLAPYATYTLSDATVDVSGGLLQISFALPEGLLGFPSVATFTGSFGGSLGGTDVTVSGPQGTGTCHVDGTVECALTYYAVQADLEAVGAYWRARGDAFVDARVQVASLFDDDPLGVLRLSVE